MYYKPVYTWRVLLNNKLDAVYQDPTLCWLGRNRHMELWFLMSSGVYDQSNNQLIINIWDFQKDILLFMETPSVNQT